MKCWMTVLLLFAVNVARAAAPEPERVQALLRQLDDRRFSARQEADRALRGLGIRVVPQLRDALRLKLPLEVARRIDSIITELTTLPWRNDVAQALQEARRVGKPVLVFSTLGKVGGDVTSLGAEAMRQRTFTDLDVIDYLRTNFVLVWHDQAPADLYTDFMLVGLPLTFSSEKIRTYPEGKTGSHRTLFCAADGTVVSQLEGFRNPGRYLADARAAHELSLRLPLQPESRAALPKLNPMPFKPQPLAGPVSKPVRAFLAKLEQYVSDDCGLG